MIGIIESDLRYIDRVKHIQCTFDNGETIRIDQILSLSMSVRNDDKSIIDFSNSLYDNTLADRLYAGHNVKKIDITYVAANIQGDLEEKILHVDCNMIVGTYNIDFCQDKQGISVILVGTVHVN